MLNTAIEISERNCSENNKKLRRNGQVPCIMYGEELKASKPIKIPELDLTKLLNTHSKGAIIKLKLNDVVKNCVVKNVQKDNLSGQLIHVDFQCVNKNETIKMKIPVHFVGMDNLQLKKLVLDTSLSEIEMQGNVEKIPEHIKIDVSDMNFGDKILAKNVELPKDIKLLTEPDTLLAVIVGFNQEEDGDESEGTEA